MVLKFDPSEKRKREAGERTKNYDLHQFIKWLNVPRGGIVADIGCGTGHHTIPLAALVGEEGRVYACDISEEMLDAIKGKIERWNIGNITPVLSGESAVPVDDETVDFVLLSLVFHELESPELFLPEIKRILKKHGRIGILEWRKTSSAEGPPQEDRISMEDAEKLLAENGLMVERNRKIGKFHYAIIAARQEDLISEKIEKVAEKLIGELVCISDREMRGAALAERFGGVKDETVVEMLRVVCSKASEKRPHYAEILEQCFDIDRFRQKLGLERMSRIYTIAKKRSYAQVVRLLMDPSPKGRPYNEYDFVEGRDRFDVTLGEKRSLAKGQEKNTLDRLLYDEDPTVIRNLLNNPRLTEKDVLKIVSKRPHTPEVLKVIFESAKWSSRYVVKKALVFNPFTPTGIALRLVILMQQKDLRIIASDRSLHEEIRSAAAELLKKGRRKSP